jgi:molybdenum ABC transporter molybdate-binding protein
MRSFSRPDGPKVSLTAVDVSRSNACARSVRAVKLTVGPSGLLKERIEAGEAAQVFASANMSHPEALRNSGRAVSVQPFARNALCALGAASFSLQGKSLVQRLLDPEVRVGTSTPGADPAGDYAFQMFERIETSGGGAGAAATLKAKALQLTGGPRSASAPAGRSTYAMVMALGQADVFVTYCTNAAEARQELPSLQVITVPDEVNVAALYGIATLSASSTQSRAFVDFVRGPDGRKILARHGFSPP